MVATLFEAQMGVVVKFGLADALQPPDTATIRLLSRPGEAIGVDRSRPQQVVGHVEHLGQRTLRVVVASVAFRPKHRLQHLRPD